MITITAAGSGAPMVEQEAPTGAGGAIDDVSRAREWGRIGQIPAGERIARIG